MNTVLVQEVIRYNRLLAVVHSSIEQLRLSIKGIIVASTELEEVANSIFMNCVPDQWAAKGYVSLKPLAAWNTDLERRMHFVCSWIENGAPSIFWFPGFFFPQAFLTGTRQNFARKNSFPIDTVDFEFIVRDELSIDNVTAKPDSGCLIHGLFIEGGTWDSDRHLLAECKPKVLFSDFPIILFKPVQFRVAPKTGIYHCPIYKVLSRAGALSTSGHSTNFIIDGEVPTDMPERLWITRSVALFTQLRY
jgi:dynein heavy chain